MLAQKRYRKAAANGQFAVIKSKLHKTAVWTAVTSAVAFASLACGSPPTDVRTVIPGDALIYLETRDLGKAVGAITESAKYQEAAKTKPDLSALNGLELAVAVTGFELTEKQITEESSVVDFQPRFVAVAETKLWNFQAIGFVEEQLGLFISETYGGAATLVTSDKHDGKYFVWTAEDGRKAYALVIGSLIFFGNDESSIEKCLAVRRDEIRSISGNPKILGPERLVFGYISPEGVSQIANLAGISLAKRASEESEVQSFVARVLPEILRNTVREATWTATSTDNFIEDRLLFAAPPELGIVFSETIVPNGSRGDAVRFVPQEFASVTRYDLRDLQVAWRSLLLTAQKTTDAVSGDIIAAFSGSLFEPYGIDDAEGFFASVGTELFTIRFDDEGEKVVAIANVRNVDNLKRSLAKEINFTGQPEKVGSAEIWRSAEDDVAAAFVGSVVIVGDRESVLKAIAVGEQQKFNHPMASLFAESNAVSATVGYESGPALRIADVLSERKTESGAAASYFTEMRFNQNGIERRVVSDFGLIGLIIEQFSTAD